MPRRKVVPAPLAPAATAEPLKELPKKRTVKAVKKTVKKKVVKVPRKTPSTTAQGAAPHEELRPSTPQAAITRAQQAKPRAMTSTECFVYGGVVCLVGTVALGLLLGFVLLPPLVAKFQSSQYSYAAPLTGNDADSLTLPASAVQNENIPEQEEYGFYGTILSKEKDVVMIKELLPPLPLEKNGDEQRVPKTFVVRVTGSTEYTYQKPREKDNVTAPPFTPETGSLDQLKENMFIFVSTSDDPEKGETVQAQHVLYSELSPFAE